MIKFYSKTGTNESTNGNYYDQHHLHYCYYHGLGGQKQKPNTEVDHSPSDRSIQDQAQSCTNKTPASQSSGRLHKCINQARNERWGGAGGTLERFVPSPKGIQTNYFKIPVLAKQNSSAGRIWPMGDCFSPPELGPLLKLP